MSNFSGMGTCLYPQFQTFLGQNPDVYWIAVGYARDQLLELGVPVERIRSPQPAAGDCSDR
ncbi:MAG: hypothetical protein JW709_07655 [Sedimentisphaerales bacterium]|nr:hypothetical protein [Sedimentisphaerales bacterium]